MKTAVNGAIVLLLFGAVSDVAAQDARPTASPHVYPAELPPPILRPSQYAIDRAKEMDADVFKLIPKTPYQPALNWFTSAYSKGPLGEGSFLRVDLGDGNSELRKRVYFPPWIQVSLNHGELNVGGGFDYGFFTDLGERDLRTVDKTLPEAQYFLSYKPPRLESDIPSEIEKRKNFTVGGLNLVRSVPVKVGHTYLVRSIQFIWSDMVVVFNVLETFPDGSITIVWKKLAEFEMPLKLFMPDAELQQKVDAALADLRIEDLQVTVRDNRLVPIGLDVEKSFSRLKEELSKRGIPDLGIDFSRMRRSTDKPSK